MGTKVQDGMEYTSADTNGQSVLKVTYPQTLSCGVSARLLENLRAEVSGGLVFHQFLDLDGVEKNYNIGYNVGGCIEWSILENFKLSTGYVYNNTGIKPEERTEADPLLTSHTVGGGFGFKVNDRLDISIGLYNMIFEKVTQYLNELTNVSGPTHHYMEKSYDETRFSVGIGFACRM